MNQKVRIYRKVASADTNAAVIYSSGVDLVGGILVNTSASTVYVKLYDQATTPDENDTPILTIGVTAGATVQVQEVAGRIGLVNGLAIRMVGGAADNSTTALTAGDIIAQLFY